MKMPLMQIHVDVMARNLACLSGPKTSILENLICFHFLNQVLQKPSVEARQQLTVLSRQVANAVSEIVHAAEAIKGTDIP